MKNEGAVLEAILDELRSLNNKGFDLNLKVEELNLKFHDLNLKVQDLTIGQKLTNEKLDQLVEFVRMDTAKRQEVEENKAEIDKIKTQIQQLVKANNLKMVS